MAAVAELELPAFDYTDPSLTGARFHEPLARCASGAGSPAPSPVGFFVLDREAATFFLRTPKATFPGRMMLEVQGVTSGPLYERMRGNLLDLDGDDHRRLRKLVQPAFTPPAADRHRPAMRRELEDLFEPSPAERALRRSSPRFAKPYPALMIAEVMGAPLGGRRPAAATGRT